jgi:uncharacterized protein YacL
MEIPMDLRDEVNSETISSANEPNQEDPVMTLIRRELALIITGLVVVIALVASFQIGAMPVLDKVLPLVTLIVGFFFGHKTSKL